MRKNILIELIKHFRNLSMQKLWSFTFIFFAVLSKYQTLKAQGVLESRPNIIFILTDDQRYDLLGCTGNEIIKTPNIDKLASDGILFTNAHVTSAICTPSRASILLSQYERKHGVNFNSGTSVSTEAWKYSYPMILRDNGYFTGYIGKNHVPVGHGGYESGIMEKSFDYWYAGHGHLSFYPKSRHEIFKGAKNNTQVEVIEEGVSDFLSNEFRLEGAEHFINAIPENKPFCLNINFNLPHGASTSTMKMLPTDNEMYKSLYRDQKIRFPENYIEKDSIKNPKIPSKILHANDRQRIYDFVDNKRDLKERIIRNMQAVTGIDNLIGKLRQILKKRKLDSNTIIIFTSDHGIMWGENGLGGKALCYEVCTRVPLIIYNPLVNKKQRGIVSNELVQSIDLAPTMLTYASIPIPDSFQGKPLNKLVEGQSHQIRKYLFTENLWSTHFGNPRCEAVQDSEWKYIRYYKNENLSSQDLINTAKDFNVDLTSILYSNHDPQIAVYRSFIESPLKGEEVAYEELFQLKTDPDEQINLAYEKKYLKKLEQMRSVWKATIKKARGSEKPKVVRYTKDSEYERLKSIN